MYPSCVSLPNPLSQSEANPEVLLTSHVDLHIKDVYECTNYLKLFDCRYKNEMHAFSRMKRILFVNFYAQITRKSAVILDTN